MVGAQVTPEAIAADLRRPVPSSGIMLNRIAADALDAQRAQIGVILDQLNAANKAVAGMAATVRRLDDEKARMVLANDRLVAEVNALRRVALPR